MNISADQIEKFHTDGFVVVDGFLSEQILEQARINCDKIVEKSLLECGVIGDAAEAIAEVFGCIFEPVALHAQSSRNVASNINYSTSSWRASRSLFPGGSVLSDALLSRHFRANVAQIFNTELSSLFLLNEQFIVKPPVANSAATFAFHQDGSYLGQTWRQYESVSVWIALDDCDEENGCLSFVPFPATVTCSADSGFGRHARASELYKYTADELESLLSEDFEAVQELEELVPVRAGAAIFISPFVLHRSGENFSAKNRRAWMPQFTNCATVPSAVGGRTPIRLQTGV